MANSLELLEFIHFYKILNKFNIPEIAAENSKAKKKKSIAFA